MVRRFFAPLLVVILALALASEGCRRGETVPVDEGGHAIVEDATAAEKKAARTHERMLEEMKSFDESVDAWMTDSEIHPENQNIDLALLQNYLKGRLKEALRDGQLLDPVGNPYVILPLSPNANVRIAVNPKTAALAEFADADWGEYAPAQP